MLNESILAGFRYDSNANIEPEGQRVQDDFVMVLSPQFELVREGRRVNLSGSYRLTGSFYFNNPDLNDLAHNLSADMEASLSQQTTFSLSDRFGYTRESLETSFTLIQGDQTSTTSNAFTLGLNHAFTPRTSGNISISDTLFLYDGATVSSTRTDSGMVGIGFTSTERTTLSISYTLTNIHYNMPVRDNNFVIHSAQAGFGYQLTPSVELSLSGGAVYTPMVDTSRTDWIATGTFTKSFERSTVTFGYSRSMSDTSGLINELNINETYSASIGHNFTERFSASLSGSYSENHTTPIATIDLTSYGISIGCSWHPYSWMTVDAGYQHYEQDSRGAIGEDYKRENVYLNFTASRSRRF